MSLTLTKIEFVLPDRALPLRLSIKSKNPSNPQQPRQSVCLPEWPPKAENNGLSPVMIPLCYTGGQIGLFTPIVSVASTEPGRFEIRAREVDGEENILGVTLPRLVSFPPGELTQPFSVKLSAPLLRDWSRHQVNFHLDNWVWEFRSPPDTLFHEFGRSWHQVYTTLGPPQSPWKFGAQPEPWLEVLQQACFWARGARSARDVADRIAKEVYKLGEQCSPAPIEYTDGDAHYVNGVFDCDAFLDYLLEHDKRRSSQVNCVDVAAIVTTFANLLGARLSQAQIGLQFETKPVRLIGQRVFKAGAANFHEVAWDGAAGVADPVWDACLAFPAGAIGAHENPVGISFGSGPANYGERFLAEENAAGPIGPCAGSENRPLGSADVKVSALATQPGEPVHLRKAARTDHLMVLRFSPDSADLDGFQITGWKRENLEDSLTAYQSVWSAATSEEDRRLRITAVPLPSDDAAFQYLSLVHSRFSLPVKELEGYGDVAFGSERGSLIVLIAGNLFLNVANIGLAVEDVRPIAKRLVTTLTGSSDHVVDKDIPSGGIPVSDFLAPLHTSPEESVVLHPPVRVAIENGKLIAAALAPVKTPVIIRKTALPQVAPML